MLKKKTFAALGRSGFASYWDAKYHFLCCSENWRMFPAYIWVIRVILGGSEHDLPRKSQLTLGRYFVFWWHSMFYSVKVLSVELHVHCEHQGHPDSVELPARITLSVSDRHSGSIVNPITVASRFDSCHLFMFKIHEKSKELCNEERAQMKEGLWPQGPPEFPTVIVQRSCDHEDPLSFPLW